MAAQNPLEEPLKKLQLAFEQAKPIIMAKAGAIGVQFFLENFQKQGFQGYTFQPWAPRKSKKDAGRAILVKTHHLANDTRVVSQSNDEIIWGNSMPYSQIHNEGGTITHSGGNRELSFRRTRKGQMRFTKSGGRYKTIAMARVNIATHSITMPKREFIGFSPVLNNRLETMMLKELLKQFK